MKPLKQIETPRGTLALLSLVAIAMTLAWLFLYYGVFLARGSLH